MNFDQVGTLIAYIASIVSTIVGYGLLLLILAVVVAKFGGRVPLVPAGGVAAATGTGAGGAAGDAVEGEDSLMVRGSFVFGKGAFARGAASIGGNVQADGVVGPAAAQSFQKG